MKNIMKKRGAVLAVVSLMLCVAVYLNWSYSSGGDGLAIAGSGKVLGEAKYVDGEVKNNERSENSQSGAEADDYFSKARLTRQQARDQAISILKQTSENEKSTESDRQQASAQITRLASDAVKESRVENLVKAKGYAECVESQTGITVSDAAKIKDIAASETLLGSEKIKIIEASSAS